MILLCHAGAAEGAQALQTLQLRCRRLVTLGESLVLSEAGFLGLYRGSVLFNGDLDRVYNDLGFFNLPFNIGIQGIKVHQCAAHKLTVCYDSLAILHHLIVGFDETPPTVSVSSTGVWHRSSLENLMLHHQIVRRYRSVECHTFEPKSRRSSRRLALPKEHSFLCSFCRAPFVWQIQPVYYPICPVQ